MTTNNSPKPRFSLVVRNDAQVEPRQLSESDALRSLPSRGRERGLGDLIARPVTTMETWAAEGRKERRLARATCEAQTNVGEALIESKRQQALALIGVEFHKAIEHLEREVIHMDADRREYANQFYIDKIKAEIQVAGDALKDIDARFNAGQISEDQAELEAELIQTTLQNSRADWNRRVGGLLERYFEEFSSHSINNFK